MAGEFSMPVSSSSSLNFGETAPHIVKKEELSSALVLPPKDLPNENHTGSYPPARPSWATKAILSLRRQQPSEMPDSLTASNSPEASVPKENNSLRAIRARLKKKLEDFTGQTQKKELAARLASREADLDTSLGQMQNERHEEWRVLARGMGLEGDLGSNPDETMRQVHAASLGLEPNDPLAHEPLALTYLSNKQILNQMAELRLTPEVFAQMQVLEQKNKLMEPMLIEKFGVRITCYEPPAVGLVSPGMSFQP